jgi:hypothetical protein
MSNVVELEQYKQHIAAEAFATEMVEEGVTVVDNIEPYKVRSLMTLVQASQKLVCHRSDLEEGDSSSPRIVMAVELQRAARFQRYQVSRLGRIIRLTFRGNCVYDLYIEDFIDEEFLEEIMEAVQVEGRTNYLQSLADKEMIRLALDEMLDKEINPQS